MVPNPAKKNERANKLSSINVKRVIFNPSLIKLNISIFSSHLILMANFVVIPITLKEAIQIEPAIHWQVYLTAIFLSLFIMVPFMVFGERLNKEKLFLRFSIILIMLSQIGLALFELSFNLVVLFLILFFGAFNYLEALLPSMVSKTTHQKTKGTALGVYSTSQFIGIFMGGLIGGFFFQHFGLASVHVICLFMTFFWICLIVVLSKMESLSKNELEEEAV